MRLLPFLPSPMAEYLDELRGRAGKRVPAPPRGQHSAAPLSITPGAFLSSLTVTPIGSSFLVAVIQTPPHSNRANHLFHRTTHFRAFFLPRTTSPRFKPRTNQEKTARPTLGPPPVHASHKPTPRKTSPRPTAHGVERPNRPLHRLQAPPRKHLTLVAASSSCRDSIHHHHVGPRPG